MVLVTPPFRSPVVALRSIPDSAGRLPTGFETLDAACRGGLRIGEVITFVGGPGAAKTTKMQQIAKTFAFTHRSPVVALHADEGDGPASIRLGQMLGLDRDLLEKKDAATVSAYDERVAGFGYNLLDPVETTLEEAIQILFAMAPEYSGPPVLLVDTLHSVACSAGDDSKSEKERAERIVEVYRKAATLGCIVLVGSEAVKSFYASKDPNKQTTGMAAAAESRAIAHKAEVVIAMRPTDDEAVFEARIEKNRITSAKPKILLRLDKNTALLEEADACQVRSQKQDAKEEAETEERLDLQNRIEKVVQDPKNHTKGYGVSTNLLAVKCHVDKRKKTFVDALYGLTETQKALEVVEGPRNGLYYRRRDRPVVA
jgi:hypothetical protein